MTGAFAQASLHRVALVGTPNCGKTSLFNSLTGGRERVGNYPGVTVEKVTGRLLTGSSECSIEDIPGLYSLRALSIDEHVAINALKDTNALDAVIFVCDAVALERSLFLFSQVAELGLKMVVALTMVDVAQKEGRTISTEALEKELGVPVVVVLAHKGEGLKELKDALGNAKIANPDLGWSPAIVAAAKELEESPSNPGWATRRILGSLLNDELETGTPWGDVLEDARKAAFPGSLSPRVTDAQTRYSWSSHVVKKSTAGDSTPNPLTQKIDYWVTHKVFGLLIFAVVMYAVFLSIYTLAAPFMGLIETGVGWIGDQVSPLLASNEALQSLVVDGVIGGVGSAIVFLPQIIILFAFIAILEGSGYLARASFLMDRLLGWCGLSGRAFIPLLSSFACAIPGIMAARVMPNTKSRLLTIMVAPLMSCSARLPVYLVVIGAFIEPQFGKWWAGFALLVMHFIGLIIAVPTVWIINRKVVKADRLPFVMDMPRYQWPKLRDIWITITSRATIFLKTAGTVIVVMSIVIWGTLYFPRSEDKMKEYRMSYSSMPVEQRQSVSEDNFVAQQMRRDSYLGQVGRTLEPVFVPAGFDWRITTAILASFPAREVVVSALGVLFSVGEDADEESQDLRKALSGATWPDGRPLMTLWNAAGLMVFFALCAQCMSTLAVMRRETGSWKWPVASFIYMTTLGYVFAVIINQVGRLFGS